MKEAIRAVSKYFILLLFPISIVVYFPFADLFFVKILKTGYGMHSGTKYVALVSQYGDEVADAFLKAINGEVDPGHPNSYSLVASLSPQVLGVVLLSKWQDVAEISIIPGAEMIQEKLSSDARKFNVIPARIELAGGDHVTLIFYNVGKETLSNNEIQCIAHDVVKHESSKYFAPTNLDMKTCERNNEEN